MLITRKKVKSADNSYAQGASSDRLHTKRMAATWTIYVDGIEIGTQSGANFYPINREAHSCYPKSGNWNDVKTAIERKIKAN